MMQQGIQAFLPAVIVSIGSVVLMMQIAFWRRPSVSLLIYVRDAAAGNLGSTAGFRDSTAAGYHPVAV